MNNWLILNADNIDTDIIIPKQFLKQTTTLGLGKHVFHEWRYDEFNNEIKHILNEKNNANILVTGENFGCGSSREHAAWALKDYGFQIIIASSFSDIFYRNWLNNHCLPIALNKEIIDSFINEIKSIEVDLKNLKVCINNISYPFELSKKMHNKLLLGTDEIDYTLQFKSNIEEYEKQH